MATLSIPLKLLLSLILGAVIGLEREAYEKRIDKTEASGIGSLGVRSFSLVTTLGAIAGLFYTTHYSLFLVISITFMSLLLAYYIIGSVFTRDNGITTELAIIFSFLIGIFVALDVFPIQLIIALVVVLIGILAIKEKLHLIVAGIKESEFSAFISYSIIALVILPFLPNQTYSLADIPNLTNFLKTIGVNIYPIINLPLINLFSLWKVVVIVTGVDVFGYILEKTIGQKKGWLLTSLAGGFISSTSTTQSLAQRSKTSKSINKLTAAAIFSNFSSFIQHFILIASINGLFFTKSLIYVILILCSSLTAGLFFLNQEEKNEEELPETKKQLQNVKIFSMGPALKFAFIFLIVTVLTKISLVIFGNNGFLLTSALAAVTGLDAVTINVSQLVGTTIVFQTGLLTLIIANAVNLTAKSVYSFLQGNIKFSIRFSLSMLFVVICSLFSIFFFV